VTDGEPGAPAATIVLRRAGESDRDRLLGWRNLPEIVALSSSQRTVTTAEHGAWFAAALADPGCHLLIVEVDGEPVGHIRLQDSPAGYATITVYLVPGSTGRGIGVPALRDASRRSFEAGCRELRAFVLTDNARSIAAFTRAGFGALDDESEPIPEGHVCLVLRSGLQ